MSSTSLPEVHASIATRQPGFWRRMMAFAGPAYLVSVGYMDPGNWATDLEGGARFGYQLLWVLVVSNFMAILLQTLSARLGIVAGRDLAQACRESYPKHVNYALWFLCEIAIAACDLAEVLGAAIALNLLFKIPLIVGVVVTAADILLVLWFTRYGIRAIEAFVLSLIAVITGCFLFELWMAKPIFGEVISGLVPRLTDESLYVAIGILGATVMPHNLYLHSALVQTRRIGASFLDKRIACRFNLIDSVVALNGALIVNAAILILAAAVFFKRSIVVTEIQQAHLLLSPVLGTGLASVLFAVALLASGQSSTLTGTMAGQIVMEGFLDLRMRPWLRRLVTRMIAIIPAVLVIHLAGEHGTYSLLILSQVILSLQLPFAVVPLVRFTSDRARMGDFANSGWVRVLAWASTTLIVGLNARLVFTVVGGWAASAGVWVWLAMGPIVLALGGLLVWVATVRSVKLGEATGFANAATGLAQEVVENIGKRVVADLPVPVYRKILVPLDHTDRDRVAISHAAALGRAHGAKLYLFHVEEGVTSVLFGAESSTAEVSEGERYFNSIVESLEGHGVEAELVIAHGKPRKEIVRYARELSPDLVVMGAHGHRGLKDLIYGATINSVRHEICAPVLVVGE